MKTPPPERNSLSKDMSGDKMPPASRENVPEARSNNEIGTSETRYRRLFEAARDGILILNSSTRQITDSNPFMTELLGYNRHELVGKELWQIGLLKDVKANRAAFRELQKNYFVRYDNLPLQSKTGHRHDVEFVSNLYEEGGEKVIQCNIRDITDRRKKEKEVYRERALLRALIDTIPDLIFFKDRNSAFLGCNKAFEKHVGVPEKGLIGQTDYDIVPRDLAEQYRSKDKELLATGRTICTEDWIPSKNGEGGYYETVKAPYFGPDGESLGLIGVSRDITERKQAQQRLTLLDTCIANLNDIVLVTQATPLDEPGSMIVFANQAFERITGYAEEEALGRTPRFLQGPKTDHRVLDEIRQALVNQQPIRRRLLNYGKDGGEYWLDMDIVPIFDEGGKCTHFAAIERDITEEKEAEAEILLKTAFFECLANSALDGILIVDGNGMKVLENQQMIEMWEIPPHIVAEEDISKQLKWALGGIKNPEAVWEQFTHISNHPTEISRDEIELINGKIFDRYSSPVQDKLGNCFGRIWKFRDITEARGREKRLAVALEREQELSREAQAGNRAKSDFLAIMSHEIRTPMNAILGFSELLSLTPDLPADSRDYIQTITSSGEALLRILNDILDYSRLEASSMQIEKKSFSPREVLEDIHTLLAPHACDKGLTFQLSLGKEVPKCLLGDAGRLRQILINLTSNAIKFTERGSVTLGVRVAGEFSEGDSLKVEFFVQDTGAGIPVDKIDEIFKPFTQLDSGSS
ncbi:MAG: PAS domain S-box protein, partial [Chthoniobacterales bacterium]